MNLHIREVADKLYDYYCDDKSEKITVFVESTFQLEKCCHRNKSQSSGSLWRFGANILIEYANGKKSGIILDSEKLISFVGKCNAAQLRRHAIEQLPLESANPVPVVHRAEIHDVYFSRSISVASTEGETIHSQRSGRRCELDILRNRVETARRWFSESGDLDFDTLLAAAEHTLDALTENEVVGSRRSPVLFHGATAALLFHELLGHPLEADNYSVSKEWLKTVDEAHINRELEFYDDPSLPGGYGSYQFDDLGFSAEIQPLLVDGRFHVLGKPDDATSASTSQRRQDYRFPALVRASNAVIKSGSEEIENLSSYQDGGLLHVYAVGSGRINNQNGMFEYSVPEAMWVERTGRVHSLTDVLLRGKVSELLERIEGVANDVQEMNVTCGKKGQFIPMGARGPSVRFGALNWTC